MYTRIGLNFVCTLVILTKVFFWMPAIGASPTNWRSWPRHSSWVSLGVVDFFFSLVLPLCFRFSSRSSTFARFLSACLCLEHCEWINPLLRNLHLLPTQERRKDLNTGGAHIYWTRGPLKILRGTAASYSILGLYIRAPFSPCSYAHATINIFERQPHRFCLYSTTDGQLLHSECYIWFRFSFSTLLRISKLTWLQRPLHSCAQWNEK